MVSAMEEIKNSIKIEMNDNAIDLEISIEKRPEIIFLFLEKLTECSNQLIRLLDHKIVDNSIFESMKEKIKKMDSKEFEQLIKDMNGLIEGK
jgi:hypothetical protein